MKGRACNSPKRHAPLVGRAPWMLAANTTKKNISKTAGAEGLQKSELTLLFREE